jgi:hypothetical protein
MSKTSPSTTATAAAAAQPAVPTPGLGVKEPSQDTRNNTSQAWPSSVDLPVWACVR